MSNTKDWKEQFVKEIEQAKAARKNKNEGMARVCARRAAGIVIGEYLARRGIPFNNPSSYERLKYLISMTGVPIQIKQSAEYMILRVDQNHHLPIAVDLIAEANFIKEALLEN